MNYKAKHNTSIPFRSAAWLSFADLDILRLQVGAAVHGWQMLRAVQKDVTVRGEESQSGSVHTLGEL